MTTLGYAGVDAAGRQTAIEGRQLPPGGGAVSIVSANDVESEETTSGPQSSMKPAVGQDPVG